MMRTRGSHALLLTALLSACTHAQPAALPDAAPANSYGERLRVLDLYPGVTATIVAPATLNTQQHVHVILYALPNGNSTAQTMGKTLTEGVDWHFDIQHIAAQTRALRTRGFGNTVLVYLEADVKSWPAWRSSRGYDVANPRIVGIVNDVLRELGNPSDFSVTLTGHSGGGSFAWGFIDGQPELPDWLERIAFLDSNYSFEPRHGDRIVSWLKRNPRNTLVVLAYDDREIMLDGRKVVSDSGGTWRASHRMMDYLRGAGYTLSADTLGEFLRFRAEPQIELLLHPNPQNKILHTVMIGEMNGYMHALLLRHDGYHGELLNSERAYTPFVADDVVLPAAVPPSIPPRAANALTGSAFMASLAGMDRDQREAAVLRELLAGNIPAFLRKLRTVSATVTDSLGATHTVTYEVMPDYLSIGSDEDFVRMPMNPYTATAFADAFGFVLPTRKMVNDIWAAAELHIDPVPMTQNRDSTPTWLEHHRIIERQLIGYERGHFVAGVKKDVVVSNTLAPKPNRVAIYGWHYPSGEPIQPVYAGHVDWYVDYSHGIRPVRGNMLVDGVRMPFDRIIRDAKLRPLLSDEGELLVQRYTGSVAK